MSSCWFANLLLAVLPEYSTWNWDKLILNNRYLLVKGCMLSLALLKFAPTLPGAVLLALC